MPGQAFDPNILEPDDCQASKQRLFDPLLSGPWRGHVEGSLFGSGTTILAYGNDTPGEGPRLHVHPYDETFVLIAGRARFFVGDQIIDAEAGDIVFGPKGVPHRFINLGPGRLQTLDVHHSPVWLQNDLD